MGDKLQLNYEFCEPAPPTAGTGERAGLSAGSKSIGTPDHGFSAAPHLISKSGQDPEELKDNGSTAEKQDEVYDLPGAIDSNFHSKSQAVPSEIRIENQAP